MKFSITIGCDKNDEELAKTTVKHFAETLKEVFPEWGIELKIRGK